MLDEIERLLCAAAGGPSDPATPASARPRLGGISLAIASARPSTDRRRTRGVEAPGKGRLGHGLRGHEKNATSEGEGGRGKAWCSPGRQQHATHEPLISRAMREEVPLAGLSSSSCSSIHPLLLHLGCGRRRSTCIIDDA